MEETIGFGYVIVRNTAAFAEARQIAGDTSYRAALVAGRHSWSGSDLRGGAAKWAARYKESRDKFLAALKAANVPHEMREVQRRKVLVIG